MFCSVIVRRTYCFCSESLLNRISLFGQYVPNIKQMFGNLWSNKDLAATLTVFSDTRTSFYRLVEISLLSWLLIIVEIATRMKYFKLEKHWSIWFEKLVGHENLWLLNGSPRLRRLSEAVGWTLEVHAEGTSRGGE